jgi:hypothetical protein
MNSFKVTLDRIEENIAVLLVREEEDVKINIPIFLLPEGTREGEILDITISRNKKETEEAKKRVSTLLEKLKNKNRD